MSALALAIIRIARVRPHFAGALAVIVMATDLASANARYVVTVPQALLETKPEVLSKIETAERADPSQGPFRIHRMPAWSPVGWNLSSSKDRVNEFVAWERDTLQPKHGINFGVEYTHTIGVAELYDYEWYFSGFPRTVRDPEIAKALAIEIGKDVVYYPRRGFDMWNTRYFIVPSFPNGWRDEQRGYASFLFGCEQVYPEADRFRGPSAAVAVKDWVETHDYKIYRNLQELPRAWVVHDARTVPPVHGLARETRPQTMQEILFANDPLWQDSTQRPFDPRLLAWISSDDRAAISPFLNRKAPLASEAVTVRYPSPQQAVLEANLESPGLIVLADIYYPGWELKIDGAPARIYSVNGIMRGAVVGKGPHQLVYTYVPRSFHLGAILSIVGLVALFITSALCFARSVDSVIAGLSERHSQALASPEIFHDPDQR